MRIVLIQGHPDPEGNHFCHALADAYEKGVRDSGHEIRVVDVAKLDFPLLRSKEDLERRGPPKVIQEAQSVILCSDHVVLIYPVWNGGLPALLKGFLEQTFRPAFIFRDFKPGESLGFFSAFKRAKTLKGKTARVVFTMKMPAFIYRWYFHPHSEKNTLRLAGIGPIKETLIGLVETPNNRRRERWLQRIYNFGREGR